MTARPSAWQVSRDRWCDAFADRVTAPARLDQYGGIHSWIGDRGTDRDDYRMCFGPTNVAIWSVSLAVEAQDGTEAVKRAEGFTPPPGAPRERVGHYWIDLARGWLLHGDRERALTALIKARHTAPQQTRYHPMVHETVRMLARQERRRSSPVASFATWCGIF